MFDVTEASPNQSPLREDPDSTRRTVRRQGLVYWVLRRPRPGHCLARSDGQPGFGPAVYRCELGELDFMLIDLPPGTGDIHLSLVQDVPLTGAVVVSTPQEVARPMRARRWDVPPDTINVPVLGLIETWRTSFRRTCRTAVMTFSDGMGPSDWRRMSMRRSWAKCRWCNPSEKPETRAVRPCYGDSPAAAAFRAVLANLLTQLGKNTD